MKTFLRCIATAAALLAALPACAQAVLAGGVELAEGDVRFYDAARVVRRPKVGDPIHEGESIVTGADGEVHLQMEDGGLIAVRPATRMRIVNFRAEGHESDRMTIGLLEGSFRSVTGWIAKFTRNNYTVRTPTATIGVRGTDHEPYVIAEGSALGDPGTYDKVNAGGTYIQTQYGRVDVAPGRAGFAHLRRAERPRVLAQVPTLFRATRNEARVTRRYQEIQKRLPQQREERRKFHQEQRQKAEREHPGKAEQEHRRKADQEQRRKAEQEQRHKAEPRHEQRGEARKHRE